MKEIVIVTGKGTGRVTVTGAVTMISSVTETVTLTVTETVIVTETVPVSCCNDKFGLKSPLITSA